MKYSIIIQYGRGDTVVRSKLLVLCIEVQHTFVCLQTDLM